MLLRLKYVRPDFVKNEARSLLIPDCIWSYLGSFDVLAAVNHDCAGIHERSGLTVVKDFLFSRCVEFLVPEESSCNFGVL